ncbi:MAG: succinate dehydrogenase [Hyphomicrobiaceae bacterium]|nr:succinate dehydrogenase [Hyphomicrobiaceae bacterium]
MREMRLYLLQRATAALLAPLILVHLVVIYIATGHGLTAADVLARTRGSLAWGAFYGLFVVLAAVHAGIGVRAIAREWTPLPAAARDMAMWVTGLLLVVLGLRAVLAVVGP